VLFFSYIGSGLIAQSIGRRRFFVIVGPLIATVGAGLLYVLANNDGLSLPTIIALVCVLAVLVTSPWGVIVTYINERFVTDVRATGFGVGFSLSVIIPWRAYRGNVDVRRLILEVQHGREVLL
jgi:hypothetical protein